MKGTTVRMPRPHAASARDLPAIRALVAGAGLPLEGVDETLVLATGVLGRHENLLGTASIEVHGRVGLLRSVVVAPEARGRGLGRALVNDRIDWARATGLETLVLFTETAPDFFEALGFERVSRAELPVEVHGAFEFGFCPESSQAMRLALTRPTRRSSRRRTRAEVASIARCSSRCTASGRRTRRRR